MPFQEQNFSTPDYQESSKEPKKVVIVSCEGNVTEPEYFDSIKRKLAGNLKHLVEVEIAQKISDSGEPDKVLENLENHISNKFDFSPEQDILWLVIDRESVEARRKAIDLILPICTAKGYQIAISNPTFELWLLLHVSDISQYNKEDLLENAWHSPAKNKRYLEKLLSEILQGYKKKAGSFNQEIVSLDNIKRAIVQEKLLCNSMPELLDELGTNVSQLIETFLDV